MKKTAPEVEAAVMAALLTGQGVMEVAREVKVSNATVSRLKARLSNETLNDIESKKRADFGELLAGYLAETITTLRAQARFFRNETWLKQQSAADLGLLHGIQCDKAIRLLEAIERANYEWGDAATETGENDSGAVGSMDTF